MRNQTRSSHAVQSWTQQLCHTCLDSLRLNQCRCNSMAITSRLRPHRADYSEPVILLRSELRQHADGYKSTQQLQIDLFQCLPAPYTIITIARAPIQHTNTAMPAQAHTFHGAAMRRSHNTLPFHMCIGELSPSSRDFI